ALCLFSETGPRAKGGRDLKGPAAPEPPYFTRRESGNVAPAEQDLSRIRRELPIDHVEAGRFSRAIRTDHGEKLTSSDLEADVVNRADATEGLGQRADGEHAHGFAPGLPTLRGRQSDETAPPIPCGKARTSTRMMPPRSARQYSVCRITVSCSTAKTDAPTIGPVSVWMPPSSTMTRPSIERLTWMVSGEIEPLANVNSPPAIPQTHAATAYPGKWTRFTS